MPLRALVLLLLAGVASACGAATIAVRADEWYPYNGRPGAEREGYMVDLLRAIAAEHGHAIDYRTLDWTTALRQARDGSADCVIAATAIDGAGLALTTEPFGRTVNTFFVLRGNPWRFRSAADLAGIRIGATAGYSYGATVDAWLARAPRGQVSWVRDSRRALPTLFARLLSDRIDAVVDDQLVGTSVLTELGLGGRIHAAGHAPEIDDLYIACTPVARGRDYATQFGAGLRRMRDSGELAQVLARYDLTDWLIGP